MKNQTVLISINAAWNIYNFRQGLIGALKEQGFRIVALAPQDACAARLAELGVRYVPLAMDKKGVSPLKDMLLLMRYYRLLRRIRPDVFLGYTPKPNVYGSLAAHMLGIPVINNVSGLGTAFIRQGLLTRIVMMLYRLAFRRSRAVFFQNPDDMSLFTQAGLVRPDRAQLLPGSGIDLDRFSAIAASDERRSEFRFLLVGRLLWDKGVREYVEAARLVRAEAPHARFQILGFLDAENRTAVPRAEIEAWIEEGVIDYLGDTDDVRPHVAAADCVVLPSYREGLPRTLLEAAAMARPLIATDVPGCRAVVQDGRNGFLCEVRNPHSLADAMLRMLRLSNDDRDRLGAEGRRLVEREYDERLVIRKYLEAISRALAESR